MVLKGFKFGMLLQLAVGPVCIFIFQMAASTGFTGAEGGVLGVTLIDGVFILLAISGLAAVIDKGNVRLGLKIFGAVILFIFGLSTILSQFSIELLPSLQLAGGSSNNSVFLHAIILTASNPLTIIFWAGVFSAKLSEENMKRKDMYSFGVGAMLSTLISLTAIAAIGSTAKEFLGDGVIRGLNIAVGAALIYFGIRMVLRKA